MQRPQERRQYVVVLQTGGDLWWEDFDTYEQALDFMNERTEKGLIIGPEGVEDHT